MVPSSIVIRVPMVPLPPQAAYSRARECLDRWATKQITVQNLEVVKIDAENNLILVKGAVPGPKKSLVTVRETVKVER